MKTNCGATPTVLNWTWPTLDASNAQQLKKQISQMAVSGREIVLDLRGTSFIDSTGLGALIFSIKSLRESGGDLSLCVAQPRVRRLLAMLHMHRLFGIYNEPAEALRRCATEAQQDTLSSAIAAAPLGKTNFSNNMSEG